MCGDKTDGGGGLASPARTAPLATKVRQRGRIHPEELQVSITAMRHSGVLESWMARTLHKKKQARNCDQFGPRVAFTSFLYGVDCYYRLAAEIVHLCVVLANIMRTEPVILLVE